MKFVVLLTMVACLSGGARGFGQSLTLSLDRAPLETVFSQIRQQTGLSFIYTRDQVARAKPVTIEVKEAGIEEVLERIARDQPFRFVLEGKYVVVRMKEEFPAERKATLNIRGSVINENGNPVAGATITIKGTAIKTMTDASGEFQFSQIDLPVTLLITGAELQAKEVLVTKDEFIIIQVQAKVGELDQVVMMAYGTTTRRLGTGNISKIPGEVIARQPVGNFLTTIQGRVPGLQVSHTSGLPGSAISIRIRGRSSISQGSEPLFIIDGVPYAANNDIISSLNSTAGSPGFSSTSGGLSPLASLNPGDILSVEILKDADATAIYGSRGANGVVLITTKKGTAGKTKVSASIYSGISEPIKWQRFLNTQQYLEMRNEAFANDGITPTVTNAPDLLVFDAKKYTDFQEELVGNTSRLTDAQLSVSGGSITTQYLLGTSFRVEKNEMQGGLSNKRGTLNFRIDHSSENQKFKINFSGNYSVSKNVLGTRDLAQFITTLPPNMPDLVDPSGNLVWQYNGVNIPVNPFAYKLNRYNSELDVLMGNLQVSQRIFKNLVFRSSLGYNSLSNQEKSNTPIGAQNPANGPTGSASFNYSSRKSWIVEPQLELSEAIGKGKLQILLGGTWQSVNSYRSALSGSGYTSDALLNSINGAASIDASNSSEEYRYNSFFGRINYNLREKYILNLNGRRDGSSRFGPSNRFENFGSVGFAWIFSKEVFAGPMSDWLSFGKLRFSYGITGNDQIGNYQYLDSWSPARYPYQGIAGITPDRLFNPHYQWETNKKYEAGLDLGFWDDRILAGLTYYTHRSGNQLIDFRLPSQTGFASILRNFPAEVRNQGFELTVNAEISRKEKFSWSSDLSLSISSNRLVKFDGLENSPYASSLAIRHSLSVLRGFVYQGVDPGTGIYQFEDQDGNGVLNSADYIFFGNLDPGSIIGWSNSLAFGGLRIDIFCDYVNQDGPSVLRMQSARSYVPGLQYNQPVEVLKRWTTPGQLTNIQRFTASTSSEAYKASARLRSSTGAWTGASFFRVKNISLEYSLSKRFLSACRLTQTRLFIQLQNLFTITKYDGGDPEIRDMYVIPTQRAMVAGIQITL